MWVRIAAHYPVGFEPASLAFYRDSAGSLTKRSVRTGQNIRDVRKATKIARAYLPAGTARAANRRAGVSWAKWAFHCASRLIEGGDYRSAAIQLWEGLRCSRSPEVLWEAARVVRNGARQALARYVYPTRSIG